MFQQFTAAMHEFLKWQMAMRGSTRGYLDHLHSGAPVAWVSTQEGWIGISYWTGGIYSRIPKHYQASIADELA